MGAEKIEKYENVRMETKKNKAATLLEGLQPYLSFASTYKLGQLSDVLCKTRLQVCSLVLVDNVDLSQLV